jgi:hypothetical protein
LRDKKARFYAFAPDFYGKSLIKVQKLMKDNKIGLQRLPKSVTYKGYNCYELI